MLLTAGPAQVCWGLRVWLQSTQGLEADQGTGASPGPASVLLAAGALPLGTGHLEVGTGRTASSRVPVLDAGPTVPQGLSFRSSCCLSCPGLQSQTAVTWPPPYFDPRHVGSWAARSHPTHLTPFRACFQSCQILRLRDSPGLEAHLFRPRWESLSAEVPTYPDPDSALVWPASMACE